MNGPRRSSRGSRSPTWRIDAGGDRWRHSSAGIMTTGQVSKRGVGPDAVAIVLIVLT